ncbi:hypothetical protein DOTSEDRAFT_55736 [Dothistroma septosporum NZE10]|uniref:Uncharacterized protein n=1 Tax=Dothistroma septosporum (strain NZE10 / CBS 128990) TaxID=675120 RepID=N1PEL2_DOTSN|nr:hypothetical protein DOTSEDRAFT_55736 [Dothistroma septosporum NZE10]
MINQIQRHYLLCFTGSSGIMTPIASIAVFLGFTSHAIATAQLPPVGPGKTMALDKVYDVDFDTDKDGGCKSYKEKIEIAYIETMQMAQASMSAMAWLENIQKLPSKADGRKYESYLRIKQMYTKVFGADAMKVDGHGLAPTAKEVLMTYNYYLAEHEVDTNSATKKFYLRCGDEWLKFAKATDPDPREGKQTKPPNEPLPKGIFYAPGLPANKMILRSPDLYSTTPSKRPTCNINHAMAYYEADLLILCPSLLKAARTGSLETYKAPWSIDQLIPSADVKNPTHIDTIASTIALTWLHELGHLIENYNDPIAITGGKDEIGNARLVYGWDEIVLYAEREPEKAHMVPDGLAYFGAAMYWQEFYWASGMAKTAPEGDAVTVNKAGVGAGAPKSKLGSRVMPERVEDAEDAMSG